MVHIHSHKYFALTLDFTELWNIYNGILWNIYVNCAPFGKIISNGWYVIENIFCFILNYILVTPIVKSIGMFIIHFE